MNVSSCGHDIVLFLKMHAKLFTDSMTVHSGFASKESGAPQERVEEQVRRAGPGRKLWKCVRVRVGEHVVLSTVVDASNFPQ